MHVGTYIHVGPGLILRTNPHDIIMVISVEANEGLDPINTHIF